jgi:MFS family permease
MIAHTAASNTILQTIVEEDKRGRLMSFYTLAFVGTAPLGSLLSGFVASRIGTAPTILLCGLACSGGSLVFACWLPHLRKSLRPIYVRAGILKEGAGSVGALPSEAVFPIARARSDSRRVHDPQLGLQKITRKLHIPGSAIKLKGWLPG